jgi:hypothetical protein
MSTANSTRAGSTAGPVVAGSGSIIVGYYDLGSSELLRRRCRHGLLPLPVGPKVLVTGGVETGEPVETLSCSGRSGAAMGHPLAATILLDILFVMYDFRGS